MRACCFTYNHKQASSPSRVRYHDIPGPAKKRGSSVQKQQVRMSCTSLTMYVSPRCGACAKKDPECVPHEEHVRVLSVAGKHFPRGCLQYYRPSEAKRQKKKRREQLQQSLNQQNCLAYCDVTTYLMVQRHTDYLRVSLFAKRKVRDAPPFFAPSQEENSRSLTLTQHADTRRQPPNNAPNDNSQPRRGASWLQRTRQSASFACTHTSREAKRSSSLTIP